MKLPVIFKLIIDHDKDDPRHKKVVSISDARGWRRHRQQLRAAAIQFIKNQRSG